MEVAGKIGKWVLLSWISIFLVLTLTCGRWRRPDSKRHALNHASTTKKETVMTRKVDWKVITNMTISTLNTVLESDSNVTSFFCNEIYRFVMLSIWKHMCDKSNVVCYLKWNYEILLDTYLDEFQSFNVNDCKKPFYKWNIGIKETSA